MLNSKVHMKQQIEADRNLEVSQLVELLYLQSNPVNKVCPSGLHILYS